MRGGKMLNNWRMAQLHAQEAPDRVRELEDWGALFDRTPEGLISQRDSVATGTPGSRTSATAPASS
jgi:succinate dehydrogenase / fumarate reductase flavoprotein subunit